MMKLKKKFEIVFLLGFFALGVAYFSVTFYAGSQKASAFSGPSGTVGSGSGALATDASNNLSIGAAPSSSVKFLIKAADANGAHSSFTILDSSGGLILSAANNGVVTIPNLAGIIVNANNVTAGQFGSCASCGGGNFSFPASVGVGVAGPTYKLDVVSGAATTARFGTAAADTIVVGGGAGKVTAGTYDPPYTIDGEKFATYVPGITGQKEETTGVITIQCPSSKSQCEGVIDFNSAEKGSDLWLFRKVIGDNFGKMTVLLTPSFDGTVWYKKDAAENRLTIFGSPKSNLPTSGSNANLEISYRLSAPRFDSVAWPNTREDGALGLLIGN